MSNADRSGGAREPNLRRQEAKTFEGRAATSLTRLWQRYSFNGLSWATRCGSWRHTSDVST